MSDTEEFDFGQLLEDHCSVAIKKTDSDRLKKEVERLSHENVILKSALREISEYIRAGRRMDKSLSDKIEEALKGGE